MKHKNKIYLLSLIIISFIIPVALYSKLPDLMPIHWGISGEVDNYAPKAFAAFLPPVIMIGMWLLMEFSPKIDPKKANYSKFMGSYRIMMNILITFFFLLHIAVIASSLGYDIPIDIVVPGLVGILFIVIGNYLPKSRSNFFYGIKTPWTLTSEESWRKTHRLGGKLFVLAGIVTIIGSLLFSGTVQFTLLMLSVAIVVIIPIIASYFYAKNSLK